MPRKRVLIVEDEQVVAEQLRQSLTAYGYEVVGVAYSGEQAVSQGEMKSPDVVLMDIVLSGDMDGISAAQQLQPLGIPVIYLTAYSNRHLVERAQHTEPLAYVMKPARSSELSAVIQVALFKQEQEKKRAQESARKLIAACEADDQFRLMVAGVAEYAIFTLDPFGIVTSWNRGAERIHGYTPQQIVGQFYALLFTTEDRKQNIPALELEEARLLGSADGTRWLVRQNGERYWAEGILNAIRDDAGVFTGFSKVVRDATRQKQMQEALRQSEERLRIGLQAGRIGTWQWDTLTGIDELDDNLKALFGIRSEDAPNHIQDFYALLHPDDRAQVQASFEKTRLEGVRLNTEFRVIRPDGIERWFLDQGELVRNGQGQAQYMAGACVDITERKHTEQFLKSSLQEKEVLLQEIHHRVKNNLQVITSLLTLQADSIADEPVRQMFAEACNRVRSISDIHELLYLSPDLARVDFNAYIHRLSEHLASLYGIGTERVRIQISADVVLPLAQAIPCGLILNELLTNCLQHAFAGTRQGTIRVALTADQNRFLLEVEDDGAGLPESFSVDETSALGMRLVSVLARQLRGELHSQNLAGAGTRVSLVFPAQERAQAV
jgi:PAS domain S-box-containing protein